MSRRRRHHQSSDVVITLRRRHRNQNTQQYTTAGEQQDFGCQAIGIREELSRTWEKGEGKLEKKQPQRQTRVIKEEDGVEGVEKMEEELLEIGNCGEEERKRAKSNKGYQESK